MNYQTTFLEAAPGVKLHVTDTGIGRPVVFIHGWPFSDEIFKMQYEAFINRGYRAIGITLRGFGASDKPDEGYDFDTYASDIATVMSAMHLKNVVLAGYSMGGAVAVQYLINHRSDDVTQLVLFSSNVPSIIQKADYPYGFNPETFQEVITMSLNDRKNLVNIYGPLFNLTEQFIPAIEGRWLNMISAGASQKAVTDSLYAMLESDQRPFLSSVKIPVLILHAINDNAIPLAIAQQAQQGFPMSTLVTFEDGGHWIFFTEATKFNNEIMQFLDDHQIQG